MVMRRDDITFTPADGRGVAVRGTEDTLAYIEEERKAALAEEEGYDENKPEWNYSSLAGHIFNRYQKFKFARENSGVKDELIEAHEAYAGKYSAEDLARIPDYGSTIFMNVTSTKCRAGMSWLKDILLQPQASRFDIVSTPAPDLPLKTLRQIEEYFNKELERGTAEIDQESQVATEGQQQQQQQQQENPSAAMQMSSAVEKIRKINELKRNISESLYDEIKTKADHELKVVRRVISDELVAGQWDRALSEFITDFCIYPTAFIKGPIITKEPRLTWVNGEPVADSKYVYLNKRVSPFDMYTDPSAAHIDDGDVIEHLRLSKSDVRNLIGVREYKDDIIREVLENREFGNSGMFDSTIEFEKADLERRGTEHDMNEDIIHGLHFFGSVSGYDLLDWGYEGPEVDLNDTTKVYEVECVLLNHEVVKCVINDDPLKRRPYLAASFQNVPGSIWGRSIPNLMKDIQRMCNACARALADNMGLASGPQVEVYVDRLADQGAISAMEPRKIWQLKSDPTGSGGRAIQFFSVPSNAQELLIVYQDFEAKADDVTGIPRYAYGNEKTVGAAQTARGLAMLLEGASKGIKDAVRNIDIGVIIPRVEQQFYYTLVTRRDLKYSGDIEVVTYGSEAVILKAAREAKRQEFLQITANPIDQKIMGWAGRADILREAAKELGFSHNLIPNKIELQRLEREEREMEKKRLEIEAQKQSTGLQATQLQVEGQKEMHMGTQETERLKIQQRDIESQRRSAEKLAEMRAKKESVLEQGQQRQAEIAYKEEQQNLRTNKQLAVDIARTNRVAQTYTERGYR